MKRAVRYNQSNQRVLDNMLLCLPGVTSRKMFGYPAYYAGDKMFAGLYEDVVGLKLPSESTAQLISEPYIDWYQPFNRAPMKEWIQIAHENADDYKDDIQLFNASYQYVLTLKK